MACPDGLFRGGEYSNSQIRMVTNKTPKSFELLLKIPYPNGCSIEMLCFEK